MPQAAIFKLLELYVWCTKHIKEARSKLLGLPLKVIDADQDLAEEAVVVGLILTHKKIFFTLN